MTTRVRIWIAAVRLLAAAAFCVTGVSTAWSAPRCYAKPRFRVDGSDVVDTVTGLKWQQRAGSQRFTFAQASAHCSSLGASWRLPTIVELLGLVDDTASSPALAKVFPETFPNEESYSFWSGSTIAGAADFTWIVSFDRGISSYGDRSTPYRVRCVR